MDYIPNFAGAFHDYINGNVKKFKSQFKIFEVEDVMVQADQTIYCV